MNSPETKKKSFLAKRRGLIIGLAVVFLTLLVGYFAIIYPLMKDSGSTTSSTITKLWTDEQITSGGKILLFPSVGQDEISRIEIHNPDNGEEYADWGFFYNEEANDTLEADTFYLINYEYATFDKQTLSYATNAAGSITCSARIEDHCTDFSKYGLDTTDMSAATYFKVTGRDGTVHTVIVGDKLPSGSGYYIRSYDECGIVDPESGSETGESALRDSVYIVADLYLSGTILSTPMNVTSALLGFPADTQNRLQAFGLWVNEDKYYKEEIDENGNVKTTLTPLVYARPTNTSTKDPFYVFSGLSVYSMSVPKGYYSSAVFEDLIDVFGEFEGTGVLEMAHEMTDEEGESYYGFDKETLKKYYLDNPYYTLFYKSNNVENWVYFSPVQEGSYLYAYSLVFNTICRVELSDVYFLSWDVKNFISSNVFYLQIDNCESIEIVGSYNDLGIENDKREGLQNVNALFSLDTSGETLAVVEKNSGVTVDTQNFRKYYRILVGMSIREEVDSDAAASAMKNDPTATVKIKTIEKNIYKTDEDGNDTDEIDYVRGSVTKIYRFYKLTNGRSLLTIEDIDVNGKSSGESGSFYVVNGSVEKILSAAIDVINGISVDYNSRG